MYKTHETHINSHLRNVPLFNQFTEKQLEKLYQAGLTKTYGKDCFILHQHDTGDTFYIVISGSVKVVLLNEDGKEIILSILKEGEFFGEMSLLDNEKRSASVITLEPSTLFSLTRKQFYQLISTYPELLRKIFKEIGARLRHADEQIESLAFLDVYGRTIRVLQQLAHKQGRRTKNGIEILSVPTHKELSYMVGASQETITRIIKVLKENGVIIMYKRSKIILSEQPDQTLPKR